jgi:hypothetical protein
MTSRLLLACAECGAFLPADPIADRDGTRLFGCCSCGYATVELSFPSEIAVAPPSPDSITGAAVWATVAPLSLV